MKRALKFGLILSLLLSCVGCDQLTKSVAKKVLSSSGSTSFFNDLIRFEYIENPGAFLSLGAELPADVRFVIFVLFTGLLLILMPILVFKGQNVTRQQLIGMVLVTGGGIGNLTDRIINNGQVVDFVSLGIGSLRTGIFNAADIAVLAGALLLITGLIRQKNINNTTSKRF